METWRRFRGLSAPSRLLVMEAAAALGATWFGLRLLGLRRWKAVLDRLVSKRARRLDASDTVILGSAQAIVRFQTAAARHLFLRTNCLERSLVLSWLLQRRGIFAELRMGARKENGRFEAHAWVELEGVALNDASIEQLHFVPFEKPIVSLEAQIP